jgi:hypothetical protein
MNVITKHIVLILEDDPYRMRAFRNVIPLSIFEVFHADSCALAIEMIEYGIKPNIIFFDHDLGGQQFVESTDANTGYQFAKYLISKGFKCDQAFIHSCNPAGAENIRALIEGNLAPQTYVIPFPNLIQTLQERFI